MSETKQFNVGFYQGPLHLQRASGPLSGKLVAWAEQGHAPTQEYAHHGYELRDMEWDDKTRCLTGVFAKFRTNDIPHIGASGSSKEREIDLAPNEGLIEKNFFRYYEEREILVYQGNGNGSQHTKMATYLTDSLGETVVFNPILQPDAAKRLMKGDAVPRVVELSYARPTNPNLHSDDVFTDEALELLRQSNAATAHVRLSVGRDKGGRLSESIKAGVSHLMSATHVTVARFELDGQTQPIDLIADRVKGKISVEMLGRYPSPSSAYTQLEAIYHEYKPLIEQVLGVPGHVLE